MEWLRSVDLAEYAPNLRGSGVHGGLMVQTLLITAFTVSVKHSHTLFAEIDTPIHSQLDTIVNEWGSTQKM